MILASRPAGARPARSCKINPASLRAAWLTAALFASQCAASAPLNGRALAHDVYKGNCLACHQIPGDSSAISSANIGPVLSQVRERFPDRSVLRAQIWDPSVHNPQTVMPPFGRNKVLSEEEIDAIVDYIYRY
jgi:L-cysteine S-thiosulfotransferase